MRVLIAMDSFKGNLSSLEVAQVVENGIRKVYPDASVEKIAMADGGEGTADTLVNYFNGRTVEVEVCGPLSQPVIARYGIVNDTTAIMEMAQASGITLIDKSKLNPLYASTFGTGQMILDAVNRGCRKIIIGIGGSATNDGGQGMAAALGVRFSDRNGIPVGWGGGALINIADIDLSRLEPKLKEIEFIAACDVDNPLCGENGASNVFGPQKGATPEMIDILDRGLRNYAKVIGRKTGIDILSIKGSGAAGGLGGGLTAFCHARLDKGIEIIMDTVHIDKKIQNADIVITGEGRADYQSAYGKVPSGVAGRCKKYRKPVFAIAGYADKGYRELYKCGIDSVISSIVAPMDNDEAIRNSVQMIEDASERLFRTIRAVGNY